MKIEKDAEWLRLEGKVGQLRGDLEAAERRLEEHRNPSAARQLGLVAGKTIVIQDGVRFIFIGMARAEWGWIHAAKIRKDGKPSGSWQCLQDNWQKE